MTTVSDIITRAYRESNVISKGATPTTAEVSEALSLFNSLILSTVGNEVGDGLDDLNVGGTYDQSIYCSPYVPKNVRLVLNLTGATELLLDHNPRDGQRLAVVDVAGNLATYNLTLDGNGRNIEGASTLVLNTDSQSAQWLYRADLGNWVLIEVLDTADDLPFPTEYEDYFTIMLAIRLNPRHGSMLDQQSVQSLKRTRSQLRARYQVPNPIASDLDAHNFQQNSGVFSDDYDFSTGRRNYLYR